MAVTTALIGTVDPPLALMGASGSPMDLRCAVVDVTLSAAADYVNGTGLDITTVAAAVGITQLVAAHVISLRAAAGTWKLPGGSTYIAYSSLDHQTAPTAPKLRIWVSVLAGSATIAEAVGATHFVNGDILRLLVIGI
jgi:hypothetical protein